MAHVTIVAAHFNPTNGKWYGFKVVMGRKGTHENYDVIYNGSCNGEYFDTEEEAKLKSYNFQLN